MSKADIRFDKIHVRNLKPHYKHLSPDEKRLVKAMETIVQCERSMYRYEVIDKNPDWRKTDYGELVLEMYSKAVDKKMRLSNKLNLTEEQENDLYKSCHTSRFRNSNY